MTPRRANVVLPVVVPVVAAAIIGAILVAFLSPGFSLGQGARAGVVRIYASVPATKYASIIHGVQMALDEAGNAAGGVTLEFRPLNDAIPPGPDEHWAADTELANARQAAADLQAVAYIGTYNSGAAKVSIPVLNRVHMAMISPGNTYPGLTKPNSGVAGEPWAYFPLGTRNYFRVVPADDLQGAAGAAYAAKQLEAKSFYTFDDTELYGHGVAVIFDSTARQLGLTSKNAGGSGSEGLNGKAANFSDLANALADRIISAQPDLVYFGGDASNHPGQVLSALRSKGFQGVFLGADAIVADQFVTEGGAGNRAKVYATLVGLPAKKLQPWYNTYQQRWPNDANEDFAPFGYEAGKVALTAIGKAGPQGNRSLDDYREAIRAAVAAIKSSDLPNGTILGPPWQFDANGDTTLGIISVQQLSAGGWEYKNRMTGSKTEWQIAP